MKKIIISFLGLHIATITVEKGDAQQQRIIRFGPATITKYPEGTKEVFDMAVKATKFDTIEGSVGEEKDIDGNTLGTTAAITSSDPAVLDVVDNGNNTYLATCKELGAADIVATFPDGFAASLNVSIETGAGVSATFSEPVVTAHEA